MALLTAAALVAALMAVPLVFLLIEAAGPVRELKGLIFRSLTWSPRFLEHGPAHRGGFSSRLPAR